jgi:hypothetical protein
MSATVKRGVFINTVRAICSIHESGVKVYSAIAKGDGYELDYYSMDMLDLDALAKKGEVRLNNAAGQHATQPQDHYDFWVFNWHFITMAEVRPSVIAALNGPKFTVVLELAPVDPLQLVPRGAFDGYIALDPDAMATKEIYPFPRALDWEPRTVTAAPRDIPIIGSFGFGTPGKGFEAVVQAVNLEFDRAIVRINVPRGDFVDTDIIHGQDYAGYLEELCKRVAKPGIEVRFTQDFMGPEELIDWCGDNDLNCFLYTRCQAGLAATTDQAIISGRPLITSSNDTFRHISRYLDPYPLISLRGAMETSMPKVRQIQQDWSSDAFNARFANMLADYGVLDRSLVPAGSDQSRIRVRRRLMIAANSDFTRGILDRPQRLANALIRTGEYEVESIHCSDATSLVAAVKRGNPEAVIVTEMPGVDMAELDTALADFGGVIVHLGSAFSSNQNEPRQRGRISEMAGMPIVPYFTVTHGLDEDPTIWLVGFTSDLTALSAMLQRVAHELPGVRVRVQRLPDDGPDKQAAIQNVFAQFPGIWTEHHGSATDGAVTVYTYASSSLIIFRNIDGHTDYLQNQAELAMITERAVVFSREAPFSRFAADSVYVEDDNLKALVALTNAAQLRIVQRFSEGAAFARLKPVLSSALGETLTQSREPAPAAVPWVDISSSARVDNGNASFLEELYLQYLGRYPDPVGLEHYLGQLEANVSRRKVEQNIRRSNEAKRHRQGKGAGDRRGASVQDLLALDGAEFVTKAYRQLLGRAADPAGLAHHVGILKAGESKEAIIASLHRSPEGVAAASNLSGLQDLIRQYERSQSAPWRWFGRKKNRQILNRSLNLAEHRASTLEGLLAGERQSRLEIEQHVGRLEAAIATAQSTNAPLTATVASAAASLLEPARVTFARHKSGTIHILVGQAGQDQVSPYLIDLVRALQAEGQAIRLVEWDVAAKKILWAARETLEHEALAGIAGLPVEQHPRRASANIVLDDGSVDVEDWLFVCDRFRGPHDPAILMEVDLIIESRRIGLQNAFVFHGAGPLAQATAEPALVACHEQYMQALLLADGIVAASEHALNEIEHFFSVSQFATFTSPRLVVESPKQQGVSVWSAYCRELKVALEAIRSQAPYIACNILKQSGSRSTSASELEAGFARLGVATRLVTAPADSAKLKLVPFGEGTSLQTNWLIIPGLPDAAELDDLVEVATRQNARVAILLSSRSLPKGADEAPALAQTFGKVHKVVCEDEAASSWLWRVLLANRTRFPCAEDRIVIVRPPQSQDSPTDWHAYAKKLARLLIDDKPDRHVMALQRMEPASARNLMPQLAKRPKLSLCISTYNRAKWLDANLANIFRQIGEPRSDLEVLVVDNCSTDDTPRVGEKYRYRPEFTFIRNPVNVGMLGNLAVTSQRAAGEYFWILGDDDLTRNGTIERILGLLDAHAELELIYLNYGYTSEGDPANVPDFDAFLDHYNVLQPACADEFSNVAQIAAKTENFYTAIYSHIYRRDHGMRSYCQDTSGRTFSTIAACIPTTNYVLRYMMESPAYWLGEPQLVMNSNVSWSDYGAMLELEHLPAAWDLAERAGSPVEQVDMRRANRLWLTEMNWRDLFENDVVGNAAYISPQRTIMRLCHLPEFEKYAPEFGRIYQVAHNAGNPAAALDPAVLFGAFDKHLN